MPTPVLRPQPDESYRPSFLFRIVPSSSRPAMRARNGENPPETGLMPKRPEPQPETVAKMRRYVEKYWEKTGTQPHPDPEVTDAVIKGLAANVEEVGRPLCPCNFYPDKQAELRDHGRRWLCACDEMKQWKYCHCLLFVNADGLPITEHLPEGHEGRQVYGVVADPTPGLGRESK
jgi:ferredoxin-thioredoxin reductase catalytic chain